MPDASGVGTRCRNCGTLAPEAFCPVCGQETRVELPSARAFVKEAAGRYVAIDGRLWRTLGALLFRPGFLTREYLEGRRRRYVRPARLFLVLSIAMFALFRLMVDVPGVAGSGAVTIDVLEPSGLTGPTAPTIALDRDANVVIAGPEGIIGDAVRKRVARFNALPASDKLEQLTYGMLRYGPYAMVALLPVLALLLKVLYLGRERAHPLRPRRYAEHLVFAAHALAFLFAMLSFAAVVPWSPVRTAIAIWIAAYGLIAMKVVYGGRWLGVAARAAALGVSYFVLFAFVTAGLVVSAILWR